MTSVHERPRRKPTLRPVRSGSETPEPETQPETESVWVELTGLEAQVQTLTLTVQSMQTTMVELTQTIETLIDRLREKDLP